ncbi:hypothetical protein LCL87_17010 [Rhodococcus hoagii]|nr:hypothetical protein [Prescottella equi]
MTTDEPFWQRPQPPAAIPLIPWDEMPEDRAHPSFEGHTRYGIERHIHNLRHDQLDEYQDVAVTAVFSAGGGSVELGPWSMAPDEARLLAVSLTQLADLAEPHRKA